jgi:hypothetical protein
MSETTDLLSAINMDILLALARKLGAPYAAARKPELIAALDQWIHGSVQRIVDHLSDAEKTLLAEMAYGDGQVDAVRFAARYGVPCPLPCGKSYPPSKASPLILFIGDGYGPRRLPASVKQALRAVIQKPAAASVPAAGSLPAIHVPPENWRKRTSRPIHVHESERIVFPELRSVLKLVQAGKLKVTEKSRRPSEDAVRLIGEVLVVPDFLLEAPAEETNEYTDKAGAVRAHAWGVLVQQCGWAKARSGRLALTAAGQKLLSSVDAAEFRKGVADFLADNEFDEFNRTNHIRGQSGGGRRYLTPPGNRRTVASKSIANWPVNEWIDFNEAARFIWAQGHGFDVTQEDYTLYFCELQYGMLSDRGPQINRQYLRAFLFESLATLGLIDAAYVYPHSLWPELGDAWGVDGHSFCGRYDGLLYVRLNALGKYCLQAGGVYEPPVQQTVGIFRVLSNREVTLLGSGKISAADRHMLELFASPKTEFVWELDASRILSSLESGGTVEDAIRFLESNSNSPIPETVQTMLADLARTAAAVVGAENALLIEFRDETTAALIAHDTQAAKCCYLAGTRRLAVPKKNLRAFRTAIRKLGFILPNDRIPN